MLDMPDNGKRIFLARHGQSVANLEQRVSGQIDTPLTEKGRQQAQWLSDVLRLEPLSAVYCSSLSRSRDTALPTARRHNLALDALEQLDEIHYGELQGRPLEAVAGGARFPGYCAADGESAAAFAERVRRGLERIVDGMSGPVLIVGHRKTNEVILKQLLGPLVGPGQGLNIKNKYVYRIELEPLAVHTIRLGGDRHGVRFEGIKCD